MLIIIMSKRNQSVLEEQIGVAESERRRLGKLQGLCLSQNFVVSHTVRLSDVPVGNLIHGCHLAKVNLSLVAVRWPSAWHGSADQTLSTTRDFLSFRLKPRLPYTFEHS